MPRFAGRAVALLFFASSAPAQTPDGEEAFRERCANGHAGAVDSRAPAIDAPRALAPQAIVEALVSGGMRVQGARLNGAERRAVAEFLTGNAMRHILSAARAAETK